MGQVDKGVSASSSGQGGSLDSNSYSSSLWRGSLTKQENWVKMGLWFHSSSDFEMSDKVQ